MKQFSDFFPYANDNWSYWSGYYTSRPALKRFVRRSSGLLHAARGIYLLAGRSSGLLHSSRGIYLLAGRSTIDSVISPGLRQLREAVAVNQHHDAVAGTAMQHVSNDYTKRMDAGWTAATKEVIENLQVLLSTCGASLPATGIATCPQLNISVCAASQSSTGDVAIILYNGLARNRTELVRVPLPAGWVAPGAGGCGIVDSQTVPVVSQLVQEDAKAPGREADSAAMSIEFLAQLPALGATTYFLQKTTRKAENELARYDLHTLLHRVPSTRKSKSNRGNNAPRADTVLSNEYLSLRFDGSTGLLASITVLQPLDGSESHLLPSDRLFDPVTTPLTQDFLYYTPVQHATSGKGADGQNSGAYIFLPRHGESSIAASERYEISAGSAAIKRGTRACFRATDSGFLTLVSPDCATRSGGTLRSVRMELRRAADLERRWDGSDHTLFELDRIRCHVVCRFQRARDAKTSAIPAPRLDAQCHPAYCRGILPREQRGFPV